MFVLGAGFREFDKLQKDFIATLGLAYGGVPGIGLTECPGRKVSNTMLLRQIKSTKKSSTKRPLVKDPDQVVLKMREALINGKETVDFDTEDEVAMAYDLERVFAGMEPQNFPEFHYEALFKKMRLKSIYWVNVTKGV